MIVHVAASLQEAQKMKSEGKDPIVVRANEYEVYVFTQNEEVSKNIWAGNNWSSSEGGPDDPYEKFVFTQLNEEQLVEHIVNPTKFQGQD